MLLPVISMEIIFQPIFNFCPSCGLVKLQTAYDIWAVVFNKDSAIMQCIGAYLYQLTVKLQRKAPAANVARVTILKNFDESHNLFTFVKAGDLTEH